jgi:hypothetical protein
MDRDRPVLFGDERSMLLSWLNWHRQCLEQKCADLDPEQLVLRSVPPSALSLLGLVRHMIQMELTRLHWYHDGPSELPFGEHDFDEVTDADPRETLERWRTVIRRSDEIVSGQPRLEVAGAPRHGSALQPAVPDQRIRPPQRPRRPAAGVHRRPDR